MGLNKYKIGQLITVVDERNSHAIKDFFGININKEFMPTMANTEGLDETKYKVVRKERFVFSGMQTGRDECIRISMYTEDKPVLISPAYTTFEVTATDIVIPTYFFMRFLSKEMDRYGAFCSDGSIRSNLDWEVFCDIELKLPSLEIQQKYVDIYNAMLENQQCYEQGLNDLKSTYEIIIEKYKETVPKKSISGLLKEVDCKNSDGKITEVHGINITKQFMESVANTTGVELSKYKVVKKGQFAFSGMQTGRDECIRIALHNDDENIIISPAYTVFEVCDDSVLKEYLMMWFMREESDRRGWFMSDSSIRSNLDLDRFYEIEIPIPDINIQKSIVEIYNVYRLRNKISEQLKDQIKNICPILIKGAIEEAQKEA